MHIKKIYNTKLIPIIMHRVLFHNHKYVFSLLSVYVPWSIYQLRLSQNKLKGSLCFLVVSKKLSKDMISGNYMNYIQIVETGSDTSLVYFCMIFVMSDNSHCISTGNNERCSNNITLLKRIR